MPGVWIDVNDLGTVGGVALALVMSIFVLCIVREHENLHLALYKVRQMCNGNARHRLGDSRANLLYHGLAMRQVLSFPPTLARWQGRVLLRLFDFVFFAPPLVLAWIVVSNYRSRAVAEAYGFNVRIMLFIQAGLALIVLTLSLIAALHARSMTKRWQRAFLRINPGREHAPQMSLLEWLKLSWDRGEQTGVRKKAIGTLVDSMTVGCDDDWLESRVAIDHTLAATRVSRSVRNKMADALMEKGIASAKAHSRNHGCREESLVAFVAKVNRPPSLSSDQTWFVQGEWIFRYR